MKELLAAVYGALVIGGMAYVVVDPGTMQIRPPHAFDALIFMALAGVGVAGARHICK